MTQRTNVPRITTTRQICHFAFIIVIAYLISPATFAVNLMGPPSADMKQGEFKLGAGYSHSKMDLEFNDGQYVEYLDGLFDVSGPQPDMKLKDLKINTVYVNLGYGVTDYFEVFLRLGGTNAKFSGTTFWPSGEDFDSNTDFAIGGGIKSTFYEEGRFKFGGLIQADFSDLDGAIKPKEWPVADDTVEFNLTQVRIAVGPSYEITEMISIYGGPFLHFIHGDWQDVFNYVDGGLITSKNTWNVEEDSFFGAYIGTQIEIAENSSFLFEFQHTSASDTAGASMAVRF